MEKKQERSDKPRINKRSNVTNHKITKDLKSLLIKKLI